MTVRVVSAAPKFKALVLAERGGDHEAFVVAALDWLNKYCGREKFRIHCCKSCK